MAALMLAVYATGAIGVDFFHHSLHDHAGQVVHTEEAETDPCHLSIYHQDREDGCEHKAHITKADKCKYSHVVFQSNQLLLTQPIIATPSCGDSFVLSLYCFCPTGINCLTQYLRGPPAA